MYKDTITLKLSEYTINIYFKADYSDKPDTDQIINLINKNNPQYPKDIIEALGAIILDTKIEIFDNNNKLLLISEIL